MALVNFFGMLKRLFAIQYSDLSYVGSPSIFHGKSICSAFKWMPYLGILTPICTGIILRVWGWEMYIGSPHFSSSSLLGDSYRSSGSEGEAILALQMLH